MGNYEVMRWEPARLSRFKEAAQEYVGRRWGPRCGAKQVAFGPAWSCGPLNATTRDA